MERCTGGRCDLRGRLHGDAVRRGSLGCRDAGPGLVERYGYLVWYKERAASLCVCAALLI